MFLTIKKIRMALYVWGYKRNSGWNVTWKTNVSWPDFIERDGPERTMYQIEDFIKLFPRKNKDAKNLNHID